MSSRSRLAVLALTLSAAFCLAIPAHSAPVQWTATKVEKPEVPPEIVAEERKPAPSGIAGMLKATGPEGSRVAAAWYAQPTTRYRHGILGDTIEGGALQVELRSGRRLSFRLESNDVFEDIAPRIADLDGDGEMEIVTILSSLDKGSSIAVFGLVGDALVLQDRMRSLGEPQRWLNIAGIARYSGARRAEIAFVATPHINGRLGFLRISPGRMQIVAADGSGFSNHVIGSTELRLSATVDIDGDGKPELALPSQDRTSLRIMGFVDEKLVEIATATLPAPIDKAIRVDGNGTEAVFTVGLEDGSVWQVRR
jgi:hypothetical protein